MGRICHDLELKTTPNGVAVISFRIAVDRKFQAKGEERKADFFSVVVWRERAEFVAKYFSKGRMILVEGELLTRQYTDKNGMTRDVVEIVADNVSFTGERAAGYEPGGYTPNREQSQQQQPYGGYNRYNSQPAAASAPPVQQSQLYGQNAPYGGAPAEPAAPASPAAPATPFAAAADSNDDDYPF